MNNSGFQGKEKKIKKEEKNYKCCNSVKLPNSVGIVPESS